MSISSTGFNGSICFISLSDSSSPMWKLWLSGTTISGSAGSDGIGCRSTYEAFPPVEGRERLKKVDDLRESSTKNRSSSSFRVDIGISTGSAAASKLSSSTTSSSSLTLSICGCSGSGFSRGGSSESIRISSTCVSGTTSGITCGASTDSGSCKSIWRGCSSTFVSVTVFSGSTTSVSCFSCICSIEVSEISITFEATTLFRREYTPVRRRPLKT
ncbi:hypothetical protein OGAPHI_005288 [Ogataea philodendri]|uniref:Uncharacterized protein n=1 Tax=Ogataea philodendri TaxID=1378263 RepID=A0A9P8P240_9ASCO|nr:uncharacterized protein OGAPHI_005288 [Ogataea philodendri]KAH3663885.1 hypothetical protein OGAPHI_005288 [Ogataea philodendri]